MMKTCRFFPLFILLCLSAQLRLALADTVIEVEDTSLSFELDLGLAVNFSRAIVEGISDDDEQLGLQLLVTGGVYYKNFYLESTPLSEHPLTLGYTLGGDENEQFNLVAESWFFAISEDEQEYGHRLDGINNRNMSLEVGLEYLRAYHSLEMRLRLLHDALSVHDGVLATIEFTRPIYTRRTFFLPSVGVTFISQNAADYYYGIDEDEARRDRPVYQPGHGWIGSIKLYVERPISASWSLIGFAGYHLFGNDLADSPIVSPRNDAYNLGLGLLWTF